MEGKTIGLFFLMVSKNHVDIFGTKVSITNINLAPQQVIGLCEKKSTGYICLPDAYVIVAAAKNLRLRQILNQSLLTLPDGAPLVLYAKSKGIKNIGTVSGYWLVKKLMDTHLTHYFYGSSPGELAKIKANLENEFPHARILGYKSPPWVSPNEIETNSQIADDMEQIKLLGPNIVWVGLNSPKQDYLMKAYAPLLGNIVLIGIGGVYDYLSGTMKISPEWVKKLSLRWVYRIIQNPRRLFRKTFIAIFGFSLLTLKEFVSVRKKAPADV
ncbi:MAG: WecB/TagA/CpsF family glycosyltransferase [Bacteroidales bacterium]|nr:WecB/TagA/CpsF family glycosyltransferase [Bacteroidales bacterium]